MKSDLKKMGIGDVIASEGTWELRHADTSKSWLHYPAHMIHRCPDDPEFLQWGLPSTKEPEKTLTCLYCKKAAPTSLVRQWCDLVEKEK